MPPRLTLFLGTGLFTIGSRTVKSPYDTWTTCWMTPCVTQLRLSTYNRHVTSASTPVISASMSSVYTTLVLPSVVRVDFEHVMTPA